MHGGSSNSCATPPAGATTYTYDERGDRIGELAPSNVGTCDAYDQVDRLTSIATGTGSSCVGPKTVGTYAYDGSGLRMSKTVAGTTTQFTWDESGELPLLLQEKVGSAPLRSYIYGPSGLVLEQIDSSGNVHYYHQDQLGSTRVITNSSGTVDATYTYGPYGIIASSTNPGAVSNPFLFAGRYRDVTTGLYYLHARYYDPAAAQFLTVDPAVSTTGSAYAYVAGNPLNASDPNGLAPCATGDTPNSVAPCPTPTVTPRPTPTSTPPGASPPSPGGAQSCSYTYPLGPGETICPPGVVPASMTALVCDAAGSCVAVTVGIGSCFLLPDGSAVTWDGSTATIGPPPLTSPREQSGPVPTSQSNCVWKLINVGFEDMPMCVPPSAPDAQDHDGG